MYKKISLILALVSLTSCSLSLRTEPTDFTSLYRAHIASEFENLRETAEDLGYLGNYEVAGTIRALADIPTIFSGSAKTEYEGLIHSHGLSQDSSITLKNTQLSYEMLMASGSLSATEVSMISRGTDTFLRYTGLSGNGFYDEVIAQILSKYEKSWLAITEKDMLESLSGSSEEDMMAYRLSQSISRMRLEDLERYLTGFPIWKEVQSLGEKDGLMTFEVELAKDNILALADDFALKSTGKKLDENARASLTADLESQKIRGTIGYDTKKHRYARFDIEITSTDGSKATITYSRAEKKTEIIARSSGSTLELSLTQEDRGYALAGKIGDDTDAVTLDGRLTLSDKNALVLDATISAPSQGLNLKLKHAQNRDGSFSGAVDAGVGNLSWMGKVSDKKSLESLKIQGVMIGSNLSLDLTPGTGGLLRGPLTVKNGDDTIISALVGLGVNPEQFDLVIDIMNPELPEVSSHAELSVSGKKQKSDKTIEIPKDTVPFRDLSDELGALVPTDEIWTEEVPTDLSGDTFPLEGSGSSELTNP